MKYIIATILFTICLSATMLAQLRVPAMSPTSTIIQRVGLTDIEVNYSRPIAKGRKIFGEDGIILYNKIWRTGANAATSIKFSEDVVLADQTLKAGMYALLTKPAISEWEVYFFPYESRNWNSYVKKEPAVSIKSKSYKIKDQVESLTININPISLDKAQLVISWGYTKISIPVNASAREKVLSDIHKVLAGPSINDYFQAALYLHEEGIELNKALHYIRKVTGGNNPQFFQVYREALILADLGRKKEAIVVAQKSLELSKQASNDDFVRLNENNMKKWTL